MMEWLGSVLGGWCSDNDGKGGSLMLRPVCAKFCALRNLSIDRILGLAAIGGRTSKDCRSGASRHSGALAKRRAANCGHAFACLRLARPRPPRWGFVPCFVLPRATDRERPAAGRAALASDRVRKSLRGGPACPVRRAWIRYSRNLTFEVSGRRRRSAGMKGWASRAGERALLRVPQTSLGTQLWKAYGRQRFVPQPRQRVAS